MWEINAFYSKINTQQVIVNLILHFCDMALQMRFWWLPALVFQLISRTFKETHEPANDVWEVNTEQVQRTAFSRQRLAQ